MSLEVGARVGSYEVRDLLGAGGMGEVYRARDTRLGREVAVKMLPPALGGDADRLARFEREARILGSLNHPNIAAIYGVEDGAGTPALVMELVEGDTLADKLHRASRARLPLHESLAIARQIADALDAAHARGIVHRDLKPANIKVTPQGVVKVLDFGLATMTAAAASHTGDGAVSHSPTAMVAATREGVILGTAAYMSPEQARGQAVDKRADIWSFGVVLYEMLSGRTAFAAATMTDTLVRVLEREPDWRALPEATPPGIRRLLRRCLEKDPARRLHDIADARLEIDDSASESLPAIAPADAGKRVAAWIPWLLAGASLAVAVTLAVPRFVPPAGGPPSRSVQVQRLTDQVGLEETPALSPDGKMMAFVASTGSTRQIWVRLLAGGSPVPVTSDDADHYDPRWSEDSGSLIYFTPGRQPGDPGTIWEIPALGGPARRLVNALCPGDLSRDGRNLAFVRFADGAPELATAARDGSNGRAIARLAPASYSTPRWSPDGRFIAIVQEEGGALFATRLIVVDASTGESRRLIENFFIRGLSWLADSSGLVVSTSQGSTMSYPPTYNLWIYPLDGRPASQLTFGESSYEFPDLLASGNLVISRVRTQADVWKFPAAGAAVDNVRQGVRVTRQTGVVQTVSTSPDESEVVFLSDNSGHANLWTARVADGQMRPVTREFDPRVIVAVPVWSPLGNWINFLTNRNASTPDVTLWLVKPDGSDARDLGITGAWACWSGDGRWLYYSAFDNGGYSVRKVRVDGGQPVQVRDDNAVGCQIAPDGSLYYASILTQATGAWDFEIRRAAPESGPSELLGRVAGARVPASPTNFHMFLSPDGRRLVAPLIDGSTTNLWELSLATHAWRKLLDFGDRNVMIARRVAWSRDGQHVYASVSEIDADIVMLAGLTR